MRLQQYSVALLGLAFLFSPPTLAVIAGSGAGAFESTEVPGEGGTSCLSPGCFWSVGAPGARVPVEFDPGAGPWIKTLTDPLGGSFTADDDPFAGSLPTAGFPLSEFLIIGGTTPWTDWHQEIRTPGWTWEPSGTMTVLRPGSTTPETFNAVLSGSFGPDAPGSVAEFFFPVALQPGTLVDISKTLAFTGADGAFTFAGPGNPGVGDVFTGVLEIAQFPTVGGNGVPEPASLALLGIGLAGLGFAWKKRAH